MNQSAEHVPDLFEKLVAAVGGGFALVICLVLAIWSVLWFLLPFYIVSINAHLRAIRNSAAYRP
jgi:hypothetical protein